MKRMLALLLAVLPLFLCGCEMRGNTLELDMYPADALVRTYTAILRDEIEMTYSDTETLPEFRAQLLNHAGKTARIVNVYVYNESTYNIKMHGYVWFVSGEAQNKGIYYNAEKKVANSTYQIDLDTGANGYFLYELLVSEPITIEEDAVVFLFFRYEDTEYIAAVDHEQNLVYWPKDQTLH